MPRITVVCSLCGASGVVDSDDIAEEIKRKTGIDVRDLDDDKYDLVQVCEKCAYENREAISKLSGYRVMVPGSWQPPAKVSADAVEVFGSGFTAGIIWAAKHLGEIKDIARSLASDPKLTPSEVDGIMYGAATLGEDACTLFAKIADGNFDNFKNAGGIQIVHANVHFDPSRGEDVEFRRIDRVVIISELSARSGIMQDFDEGIAEALSSMAMAKGG